MKKSLVVSVALFVATLAVNAQDVQEIAQQAAQEYSNLPEKKEEVKKPKYWKHSLMTQINVGQTSLTNWAAGGDNTFSLKGYVDGSSNWKKESMFWNNRLQLDYGLLYSSSKPIMQKSNDRIYLESKWGYKIKDQLYFSANYDFKSQFNAGYDYKTPSADLVNEMYAGKKLEDLNKIEARKVWKNARKQKSGFLAPAYTTLALGIDWNPANWVSVSCSPLTGGFTIVKDQEFRKAYSMELKEEYQALKERQDAGETLTTAEQEMYDNGTKNGDAYRSARFQFGAQVKFDFKVNVNDNFKYTSQVVLFTDYLNEPNIRFNWDNKFDWKLAKYFALTVTTNMIYDSNVMKPSEADPDVLVKRGLQFAESISFGFTYTIASKK